QNVWVYVDRDREAQSHVHPRGIVLDRLVDELLDTRELNDLVELRRDLLLRHSENGTVEEDILPARKLCMEAGPNLKHCRDLAVVGDRALVRPIDVRQALQQSGLARPIASDQTE